MSDARLRDLERRAAQGDADAGRALVLERCRVQGHDWSDGLLFVDMAKKRVTVPCRRCRVERDYEGHAEAVAIGPSGELLYPLVPAAS